MDNKTLGTFCAQLIKANEYRNQEWAKIDRMVNLEYELPYAFTKIKGAHKVTRPDPYVDILTATNALSQAEPQVKLDPLRNNLANKVTANEREKWLKWQLMKLDNRQGGSVIAKIIESAFKYHAVCFATEHVEYSWKAKNNLTGKDRLFRRAHSAYAWTYYNPQDVYWQSSVYGLERVLAVSVEPLQSCLDEYGKAAKKLENKIRATAKSNAPFKYVTKFYYCDHDMIRVWVVPTTSEARAKADSDDAFEIYKVDNDLGFIPFVCEEATSTDAKDKYKPLLYATSKSGWWHTQNALETIAMTQTIINSAKARWIHEGPQGDNMPVVDYDQIIGGIVDVPPGHKLTETRPEQLDDALITQAERLANWQQQSGAARSLTGGIGGDAFAAQSLQITVGAATIATGHKLAERALAEGLLQILAWTVKAEKPDQKLYVMGEEDDMPDELGWSLTPNEIDLGSTYLEVKLKAQNPLGKLQAANAGAIMKQFGVSDESIMEDMGIADPLGEMQKRATEEMAQAMFAQEVKRLNAMTDLEIQAQQMQMQMQLQQAMTQPPQPEMPTNEIYSNAQPMNPMPPTGVPEGPGFNSNGALAPAMVNPNLTREMQNGGM